LRNRRLVEPASREVSSSAGAFGSFQEILKKRTRPLMNIKQRHAQLGFPRLLRAAELQLGQRHSELLCDQAHGLRERDVFHLLHKRENIT